MTESERLAKAKQAQMKLLKNQYDTLEETAQKYAVNLNLTIEEARAGVRAGLDRLAVAIGMEIPNG